MSESPTSNHDRSRRYQHPRRMFSWVGVLLGTAIGIAAGLLIAWSQPVQEFDTAPWQLQADDRDAYMVAIALRYSQDGNIGIAVQQLIDLRLSGDPIEQMALVACRLATTGYLDNASGLQAVRAMMRFYQGQGRTGCADQVVAVDNVNATAFVDIQAPTSTPTLPPPDTKTPTPGSELGGTPTPNILLIPTSPPQTDFTFINAATFCDSTRSGLIEVYVYEVNGATGIPGQAIRARWDGGESTFFTGLKTERGTAYADFQMSENVSYILDMPGRADPLAQPLVAVTCTTPEGQRAIIGYRVTFRALE